MLQNILSYMCIVHLVHNDEYSTNLKTEQSKSFTKLAGKVFDIFTLMNSHRVSLIANVHKMHCQRIYFGRSHSYTNKNPDILLNNAIESLKYKQKRIEILIY